MAVHLYGSRREHSVNRMCTRCRVSASLEISKSYPH